MRFFQVWVVVLNQVAQFNGASRIAANQFFSDGIN
jgi:hypothetical protein